MFNKVEKYSHEINESLRNHGALLVSGSEKPNIMAVSWGALGYFWAKPVFVVAVRKTHLSYKLIDESKVFTINIARRDLHDAIMKIAMSSGYDVNKFSEFNLHPVKAKNIDTYIVGDCNVHIECRLLLKSEITDGSLAPEVANDFYDGHDYHTLFFAEVLDVYES